MTIRADGRAFAMLLAVISPIVVLWTFVWWRRPDAAQSVVPAVGALLFIAFVSLAVKTVVVDDVFVSSRYGSSPCLAITARGGREIRLPMKAFNLQKRQRLVRLLMERAPGVSVDRAVAATLT